MKYFYHHTKMENNNDDIADVFDLPFDGLCLFLEGTMFMSLRLNN